MPPALPGRRRAAGAARAGAARGGGAHRPRGGGGGGGGRGGAPARGGGRGRGGATAAGGVGPGGGRRRHAARPEEGRAEEVVGATSWGGGGSGVGRFFFNRMCGYSNKLPTVVTRVLRTHSPERGSKTGYGNAEINIGAAARAPGSLCVRVGVRGADTADTTVTRDRLHGSIVRTRAV